jgi:hypothetical protein
MRPEPPVFQPDKLTHLPSLTATASKSHLSRDVDGAAKTELDHFGNCPFCEDLFDMRDLGQVMADVHAQEIEDMTPEPQTS